jgi:drug/metabolite transporter (DMT)-like permease
VPRWLVYSMISIVIWGVWGLVPKATQEVHNSPLLMQVISTIGLLPISLLLLLSPNLRKGKRFGIGICGAFSSGVAASLGNVALLQAMKLPGGNASLVLPLAGIYPLVTIALAWIFFKERLNWVQGLGLLMAIAALVMMNFIAAGEEENTAVPLAHVRAAPWILWTLAALGLFGVAGFAQKSASNHISNELCIASFAMGFAVVAAFILATNKLQWDLPVKDWILSITWGVLASVGGLTLFAAYRWGKASVVTAVTALYPALTVVLAVPLFHEPIDKIRIVAIALTLGAAIALSMETPSKVDSAPL